MCSCSWFFLLFSLILVLTGTEWGKVIYSITERKICRRKKRNQREERDERIVQENKGRENCEEEEETPQHPSSSRPSYQKSFFLSCFLRLLFWNNPFIF
ncbi:hypothetical protein VIGAN_02090500 [Vigna angularis var. angularis]|uniref:Uncharacterized protein n=1 Tax=Vigna angularis var. angularis TaxID=157739 RepID=A0A0S3RCL8_PHAAN|nr:hypothetical protein VIGAN_02090500 [Vigna angularis var. angularis]